MQLSSFPNTTCWRDCFPIVYSCLLCQKLIECRCVGYLLYFFPLTPYLFLCHIMLPLSEVWKGYASCFVLLFLQDSFWQFWVFCGSMWILQMMCSVLWKGSWEVDRDHIKCLLFWVVWPFKESLILPTQECGLFSPFFESFSISLFMFYSSQNINLSPAWSGLFRKYLFLVVWF